MFKKKKERHGEYGAGRETTLPTWHHEYLPCEVRQRAQAQAQTLPGQCEGASNLHVARHWPILSGLWLSLLLGISSYHSQQLLGSAQLHLPSTHPYIHLFCYLLTHSTKHLSSADTCQRWQLVLCPLWPPL